MTNEEVEGKVLTVHEGVHGVSDDLRHHVGINVTVVFVVERCSGQHHTDEISVGWYDKIQILDFELTHKTGGANHKIMTFVF